MDREATQIALSDAVSRLAALKATWHAIKAVVTEHRDEHVRALVQAENAEARGAIKELDRILELPESLAGYIRQLEQALADLPD